MVAQIKENGRLKLTNIGGMKPANAEAENVRIITKADGIYEGTCQLVDASVHVTAVMKRPSAHGIRWKCWWTRTLRAGRMQ